MYLCARIIYFASLNNFLFVVGTVPTVVFFVFLFVVGSVPTVWYSLFFYLLLVLFRQCGIFCFSIYCWYCSDSVVFFVFLFIVGTVLTVWYFLFFVVGFLFSCEFFVSLHRYWHLLVLLWEQD